MDHDHRQELRGQRVGDVLVQCRNVRGSASPGGRAAMNRLRALGMVLALLGICSGASAAAATEQARPNIVIFIADDLSWHDVACFGGPTSAKTPNLDRLASEGMRLVNFHSTCPVCSPTRQSLLTGLYPVRSGAYPNHAQVAVGTHSLPFYLKPLGYRSICIGKTHFAPASCYPFDEMSPIILSRKKEASVNNLPDDVEEGSIDGNALERFITQGAGKGPFLAYVAPHEPHAPWNKGDQKAYDATTITMPPYLVDTPQTRHGLADYCAEVTLLDAEVGETLHTLEKTGHSKDTIVLFFSEQGSSLPHAKWTLYDPGTHAAAIVRWPGQVTAGSTSNALMQYVDIVPTLIAAAGGDPASADAGCPDALGRTGLDGMNGLAVIQGTADQLRDVVFAEHTTCGIIQGSEAYGSRSVFDGRWKLIVNLEPDLVFHNSIVGGPILSSWREKGRQGDSFATEQAARYVRRPAVELYDHQGDPWELANVASHPENAAIMAKLRERLNAWMHQQGDLGDATERDARRHQTEDGKRKSGHGESE